MTVAEIILAVIAAAFVVLVVVAVSTLIKLGKTLEIARKTMETTQKDTRPIIRKADSTLALMNTNLSNISGVTGAAKSISANVAGLVGVTAATLGGPLVKGAAFTYGVRKAISAKSAAKAAKIVKKGRGK